MERWVFPSFVAAIVAVALWGAERGLPQLVLLPPVLAVFYAAIAAAERRWPYRPEWNRSHGDVATDVAHLAVTALGTNEAVRATVLTVAAAGAVWIAERTGGGLWPRGWPLPARLALALLVAELGHYGFHRLGHENGTVWRVHAAHHSAPRLYWLNATRFHPLDLFGLLACQIAPLILLGIDAAAMTAYLLFTGVYGQLRHANIAGESGWLRWVFSTPALHRWHHSTDPAEGNHNYGAVLSTWDHLFGTLFWPADRAFRGPVGLHGLPAFPRRYLGQLLSPFRRQAGPPAM